MGFLDSFKSIFAGTEGGGESGHWIYVRCRHCGEVLKTRIDLRNDLSPRDGGGFVVRKTLVGSRHCFQRIEVMLIFDENRRLAGREIAHGEFITAEEFDAAQGSAE